MEDYYFGFDEPPRIKGEVLCAFYISNIRKNRCFFYVVQENKKLKLMYSMITGNGFINLVKETIPEKLLKKEKLSNMNFQYRDKYIEAYNAKYLNELELSNEEYIIDTISKMKQDNIYQANNNVLGLDGFSIELKFDKSNNFFYSYCNSNDKRFFYVIDFINYLLDIANIDKDYRFNKLANKYIL